MQLNQNKLATPSGGGIDPSDMYTFVWPIPKGAVKIITRLTYRERYEKSTGRDPLVCPHCRREMELWRIWHPTYGVIYDGRGSNGAHLRLHFKSNFP